MRADIDERDEKGITVQVQKRAPFFPTWAPLAAIFVTSRLHVFKRIVCGIDFGLLWVLKRVP